MSVIHSGVFTLLKKFPEHRHVVQRLFRSNDEFLTLCEDYRICKEALDHWTLSKLEQAPLRKREYASLLRELEIEILQSVDDFNYHQAC